MELRDESARQAKDAVTRALADSGEMGRRIAAHDWSGTSLGPIERWSPSLRAIAATVVANSTPMLMFWGDDLVQLYNDAYIAIAGGKHPQLLGSKFVDTWSEVIDLMGPVFETVRTGEAVTLDQQFFINRFGFLEEIFARVVSSPLVDDAGKISGVLCTVMEQTESVIGARRMRVLSELSGRMSMARTADAVCQAAADTLSKAAADIPFALAYLLEDDGERARLAVSVGLSAGSAAAPENIVIGAEDSAWPLGEAGSESLEVNDLEARFGALECGRWPEPPHSVLVLRLSSPVQDRTAGFLVMGASPRRPFDDKYREFLRLVADQLSSAINDARAWDEERTRAEQLAELDRAKTVFFNNISHEFRTPLTLILGPVERALASAEGALGGEQLDMVRRNALRLSRMVNTLLNFARMESGRARATFSPVDLAAFTADLASAFRSAADSAKLTLYVDCPPLPEPVYVDPEMWEKIVLNLLSNAMKYTHEGRIDVSLAWQGGEAVLTVADTGVGIPEDELPRVFDRFHRVQTTHGRSHEGTGIGLALVRELVDLHGGSVTAASRLGGGSTFTVRVPGGIAHLPAERVEHQPRPLSSAAAAPFVEEARRWSAAEMRDDDSQLTMQTAADASGDKVAAHILLIDDNADLRRYVAGILRRHFSNVETAADGAAAIAAIRAAPPDLVLSDVMMPGLDGFALVRELRADEHTRAVPVVLLSARAGEEATVEGLESGADDYLVKPFSARELLARVHTQLDMARLRRTTARDEIETEKLRETLEARDEFLSLASHELRTPLTAMRLQAHILARLAHDERSRNEVVKLTSSIERMGDLVTDLLDVSRITAGRLKLSPEEVDLVEVVHAAVADVPSRERRDDTQIRQSLPDAVVGRWDRGRLEQIVSKLLSNALKYGAGRPVEIGVEADDARVRLWVCDYGPGIAPAEQARIFERFERAVPAKHYGGLGLGLWTVRKIVEAMGGSVQVESGEGEGATFAVELPRT